MIVSRDQDSPVTHA